MLYPVIKLIKQTAFCTCGNPNFRHSFEFHKPCYKIYEVKIPKAPCGSETFHLCEDCLKILNKGGAEI